MKTYLDCLPCMMNQALRTARISTNDEIMIKQVLDEVGTIIKDIPMHHTPAQSGVLVYQKIREITGVVDPYKDIKKNSINEALALYPNFAKLMDQSDNKLLTAIRIAITGNIIDFGMDKQYVLAEELNKTMEQDFAIFDFDAFINELEQAKSILYIGDNAGESVFDKILIEALGKPVIYVVRGIPIINDVTMEDAIDSGIEKVAEIMSSGSPAPGTILELCDDDFVHRFNEADMVISKGQGNYEGLSEVSRSIFFLLKAKCKIIANDLGVNEKDIILKGINQ